MERLRANKVDPNSAKLATILIPAFVEPIDGILSEEKVEMVIAQGKGKFAGEIMVQIGHMSCKTKAPIGFVYRQHLTYQGFRRGRDVCVDPSNLREGVVTAVPEERGLWVKLEGLGTLINTILT